MKDLCNAVRTYYDSGVLFVTDFKVCIVAENILKTIRLLQRVSSRPEDQWELFEPDIKETFGLDIKNNDFHMTLWENWIKFIADLGLIEIGTRWGNGTHQLFATEEDIKYLEYIIKHEN